MATMEAVERRRKNRKAAKLARDSSAPWQELGAVETIVKIKRLNIGELLRGMTRGMKERALADVLRRPELYPDIEEESALNHARQLLKVRDHLEGKPDRKLETGEDPTGGLRGGMACSSSWFEANWEELKPAGGFYPPGGDESKMIACDQCGAIVPPQSIAGRRCDDCQQAWDHQAWGSSVSGSIIQQIRNSHKVVELTCDQHIGIFSLREAAELAGVSVSAIKSALQNDAVVGNAGLKFRRCHEPPVLPEATNSALRREIKRYNETGRLPK